MVSLAVVRDVPQCASVALHAHAPLFYGISVRLCDMRAVDIRSIASCKRWRCHCDAATFRKLRWLERETLLWLAIGGNLLHCAVTPPSRSHFDQASSPRWIALR